MSSSIEPIIAGSRGFALALLAPLTETVGTRPRIAADPVAAGTFCAAGGGLVVVEYLGADTLRGVEALLGTTRDVRVVVAVPEKHAAAEAPLRALGAEVARWTGSADAIVAAVGRAKAPAPGAPAQPPVPRSPAERPPPVATASAAPPAPPPAPRPPAARPASPASPVASAPVVPRAAPHSPRPTAQPSPAAKPLAPPRTDGAPAVVARSTPPAVPAVAEPPAPPALASRRDVAALAAGPAAAPRGPAWPSAVPSQAEAAEALERVRSGTAAADAAPGLADVLANVLSNLSELERSVLADEPQPVDPRPIRDAAVMRVRVAAALASVPPPGEEVDTAAVSALLAEMDALLSQVSAVAAEAPPDAQQSLEAVRNALVREAIDFSEAVQRASPAGDAPAAVAPRATARPAQARLLSMEAAPERRSVRQRAGWIVLVVVLLATATYHGWRWYEKRAARAALRKPGVPAGLIELPAVPGTPRMLVPSRSDEPLDPAEVARFRSAEEAKGNDVREENGFIYVTPSRRSTAPARSPAPAPGAPATGTRPAGGPSPPGAPDSPAHQEKP